MTGPSAVVEAMIEVRETNSGGESEEHRAPLVRSERKKVQRGGGRGR